LKAKKLNYAAQLLISFNFGLDRKDRFEVVAISINWLVLIINGALLSYFFACVDNPPRTQQVIISLSEVIPKLLHMARNSSTGLKVPAGVNYLHIPGVKTAELSFCPKTHLNHSIQCRIL